MIGRAVAVLAVALLVVGSVPFGSIGDETATGTTSGDLGHEGGYAHDDAIDVTWSDGLNASELGPAVNRTMARVEHVRELEFRKPVPVEVVNRTTFERRQRNRTVSESLRTFDNAKFEALFLVNESTDSVATQRRNLGSSVLGYYSPTRESIVLVAEDGETAGVSEYTLAHELVHALQDQHFDLSRYDAATRDGRHAQDGLIEGDAAYVEYRYRSACEDRWAGSCGPASAGGGGDLANFGVYLLSYFPYSDGPAFVAHVHDRGGWDAVNDVYGNPPVSAEQVIHPERYPEETPASLGADTPTSPDTPTFPLEPDTPGSITAPGVQETATGTATGTASDRRGTGTAVPTANATVPATTATSDAPSSTRTGTDVATGTEPAATVTASAPAATETPVPFPSDVSTATRTGDPPGSGPDAATDEGWERVRPPERPASGSVGEAALAVMFFYPSYESAGGTSIVSGDAFFNRSGGDLSTFDPFVYDQPYSEGWDGDRLRVYHNEENETGYVWELAWDSRADAIEFAEGYREVLAYRGAESVGEDTYRIEDGGFADAFHVQVVEDRVRIVNAPTIDDLTPLYVTLGGVDRDEARRRLATESDPRGTPLPPRQPGFGPVVAVLGILLALVLGARRSG